MSSTRMPSGAFYADTAAEEWCILGISMPEQHDMGNA